MNEILKINNLSKTYYTLNGEINAIKEITFDLFKNEFLSIVGTSGCGKSTLLNILSNLEDSTSGNIIYPNGKPQIGYMLQEDALLPYLTILDNACLGLELTKNKTQDNVNYVVNMLKKYGLKDFINKYPNELSGGMKQRVL